MEAKYEKALRQFATRLTALVDIAREFLANKTVDEEIEFVESKRLDTVLEIYKDLFEALGVTTIENFVDKIGHLYKTALKYHWLYPDLLDTIVDFFNAEKMWKEFVDGLDSKFPPIKKPTGMISDLSLKPLYGESDLSHDVQVSQICQESAWTWFVFLTSLDCLPCRDHVKSLEAEKEKLLRERCQVVIVYYGTSDSAKKWTVDTGCQYPVYLDPDRKFYKHLGLGRSISKTYKTETIYWHVEEIMTGKREQPKAFDYDDPFQEGGDFIFDANAVLNYSYIGANAVDRLPVKRALDVIESLDEGKELENLKIN